MKQFFTIAALSACLLFSSCSSVKNLFTAQDAEAAIREMLSIGTQSGGNLLGKGMISKETLTSALFLEELKPILNTLQTLGLSKEVDRFTTTLTTTTEKTVERSVPIFLSGIKSMRIKDAFAIVKNGGTSATDYLRKAIGDSLRHSITPVMSSALNEYKLEDEWNKIIGPAQLFAGNKLNLNISSLMSGLVANLMFNKIAEKEIEVRTKATARTTTLLQKVFNDQMKN